MASPSSSSGEPPPPPPAALIVIPERLDFYVGDRTTHKRIFTVYNPYEIDVKYKVLCNNPNSYSVVEPQGRIRGRRFVDVVVRHHCCDPRQQQQQQQQQQPSPSGSNGSNGDGEEDNKTVFDKFRVLLLSAEGDQLAKRDILAVLHQGKPDPLEESHSHSVPHHGRLSPPAAFPGGDSYDFDSSSSDQHHRRRQRGEPGPNWIVCVAGVVCIVALLLPTEGDFDGKSSSRDVSSSSSSSSLSSLLKDYRWLHLSVNMKLVFAFVLGLVTTAVLRPAS